MCPSISCIHVASYVDFPHWPLHHFLRFYCFNTGTSLASTTSCMHLVSVSKFPPSCARSKNVHGIQPNVSAYKNGVPPPPYMEARSRKQAHGSKHRKPSSETINLAVEKKIPGSSTNTCRSKKNIPTGSRKHTSMYPTFFVP